MVGQCTGIRVLFYGVNRFTEEHHHTGTGCNHQQCPQLLRLWTLPNRCEKDNDGKVCLFVDRKRYVELFATLYISGLSGAGKSWIGKLTVEMVQQSLFYGSI